jgi:hypothetical protein
VISKTERTQNIIDTYRGLPGEFDLLKGLLCLPSDTCLQMREQIDMMMIETRLLVIALEDAKAALAEIRPEITRINQAAGHTVFNPAATQMVEHAQEIIGLISAVK